VRAPILFAPHTYLEGDPVLPKLFLAPAKGGAPLDDGRVGGAVAPSASSPSKLATVGFVDVVDEIAGREVAALCVRTTRDT
jgi:hypothetical protein